MKIAIVKLSALGDIVFAMVVLQFIKKQHPKTIIDWITQSEFREILEHNSDINNIHCVNLKLAKQKKSIKLLWQELKKIKQFGQYDLVIDAQGLLKSAIVAKILDAKKIVGFDKNSIREPIASWFYDEKVNSNYGKNIILRNIDLIKPLQIQVSAENILQKKPFLAWQNKTDFDYLSQTKKNILLVIGASFECKKYPIEKYAQLVQQLNANFVVLWGGELEYTQAKALKKLAPQVKLTPKLSLDVLKSLVSKVDLVIGGDTGPVHIAWAINKPSITLFGATPGERNTYKTNINIVIESPSKVNPNQIDKNDLSIANIDIQAILKQANQLLGL